MKKITLALCACAFALTGLLASCSNDAPATSVNYTEVGEYEHTYKYAVKGTLTKVEVNTIKLDASDNPSTNGKVTGTTTTTTTVLDNAIFDVSWGTDENRVSNYTDIFISGNGACTETTTIAAKDHGVEVKDNPVAVANSYLNMFMNIREVDGVYYLIQEREAEAIELESLAIDSEEGAFDGEFGGEFTLSLKFTKDLATFENMAPNNFSYTKNSYTETGSTGKTSYDNWKALKDADLTQTETQEMKLTFYPLQDFDPEADVEEDEE